ncbi:hypothetical protein ACFORG_07385 [Lutimaribacter marinistellae]|uniref:Uncharacterized protein n=1 Tax=Lutimaribacter marinistellae TaxID=1820329 RepID=A0ABV7TFS6_9RHOB
MTRDPEDGAAPAAPPPVFLERQSYRRRRLNDAARLLPVLAAALFAVPLLWPSGSEGAEPVPMSAAILYVFTVWALLVLVAILFGIAARRWTGREVQDRDPI